MYKKDNILGIKYIKTDYNKISGSNTVATNQPEGAAEFPSLFASCYSLDSIA